MLMFVASTVQTPDGIVDLIAVERFVKGGDVDLTDAERPVAVWAAAAAGVSQNQIIARLRCRDTYVKDILTGGPPVDSQGDPIFCPTAARGDHAQARKEIS